MSKILIHVDRQEKAAAEAAATEAAQKESADAFRGLHLDPKAHHWDEVRSIPDLLTDALAICPLCPDRAFHADDYLYHADG